MKFHVCFNCQNDDVHVHVLLPMEFFDIKYCQFFDVADMYCIFIKQLQSINKINLQLLGFNLTVQSMN